MESKNFELNRKKKQRYIDEDAWDCSVCTFKNSPEAFRCGMCQTRKGTSTRKPKLNRQIVEEQNLIARAIIKEREDGDYRKRRDFRDLESRSSSSGGTTSLNPICNVDRSSPMLFNIFANGYSVIITEYKPKISNKHTFSRVDSPAPSNASSLLGFTSTPLGANSDQLSPGDQQSCAAFSTGTEIFPEFHDCEEFQNPNSTCANIPTTHNLVNSYSANDNQIKATETSSHKDTAKHSITSSFFETTHISSQKSIPIPSVSSPQEILPPDDLNIEKDNLAAIITTPKSKGVVTKLSNVRMKAVRPTFRALKRQLKCKFTRSTKHKLPSIIANAGISTSGCSNTITNASSSDRHWMSASKKRRRSSTPILLKQSPISSSRSLRSRLVSDTRQASRIAHASLYKNVGQLRPRAYQRKKNPTLHLTGQKSPNSIPKPHEIENQLSSVAIELPEVQQPCSFDNVEGEQPVLRVLSSISSMVEDTSKVPHISSHNRLSTESRNTTAMTDSCGALALEMSVT